MDEKDNSRSSLQTAADLGRAAKAAYRIAQATAVSGVHGAAAAAVKETVPALVKFLLAVLLIMIVIPMVVFTALPNIFFGYDSSNTASVIHMTEQAMRIGGAYMSLDDFERTQIDSIVTGIAAEYEADGTAIDHIEVKNTMKEDDLLWIIAINSAAYEQDLDAMSAELIQNFCQSTLSYQPSLSLMGGSTSATLEVEIKRIDPEELMEQMGFNEDARQWAGALFETLKDSGALEKYGGYFSAYQPDYSGDGSYSGDIQHGTSYDNDIDISRFVSPSTKNNLDLAAYAVQAWENNWGYVWGTYGNILTESLFAYKKQQYPDGVGNYADFIEANWLGRRTADCIGLIKGYAWLDASTMRIGYAANGMPDYGADQMYQAAKNAGIQGTDYGTVSSMPEIPGLMLWKSGHAGVYIGGGYAIEAMGTRKGVVKTEVSGRGWQGWCILHISGTADIGDTLAADITADGTGRLIVTLTESPVSTGYLAAGAVFTFWPRVTGYSEYDEVLANICDLRLAGTHGTETDFSSDLLTANDYYQTPGWLLRDLDGDGIPELLLGANWDEGHTVIFNIYRSGGARAVRVVDGWSRSRWYLCTDGSLAHEGSDGASEGTYSYYRYENGALRHLETVISLDGWLYSDTTDHYVGGKGFRPVSEDEANAVREKYTHETLSFTPFVV